MPCFCQCFSNKIKSGVSLFECVNTQYRVECQVTHGNVFLRVGFMFHYQQALFNVSGARPAQCAGRKIQSAQQTWLTDARVFVSQQYSNHYSNMYLQLLSKSLNTLSYFTQPPYHPSFSVLLKILKSHIMSMLLVSFQHNSIFYNSYIKCIEQGVFRIERITFSRYYVVNMEKFENVFKLLASNCTLIITKLFVTY